MRPQTHTPCPGQGLTCRLRRGWWGCRPEGGSTFFRSERKYQRKPAARRLQRRPAPLRVAGFGLREPFGLSSASVRFAHPPGKSLLLPILTAGLATSRVIKLDSYPQRLCALLCSPISAVKMGGPFSLRCLSPLVSPAGGAGQTQMAVLGIVSCYVGGLAASMGRPVFQFAVGVNHIQIMLVGRFDVTWIFLQGKRPA